MRYLGVDVGVRSFTLAVLNGKTVRVSTQTFPLSLGRPEILTDISIEFGYAIKEDDTITIEEPPYVNNHRIYGQLCQVVAALLIASKRKTSTIELVPVDRWKQEICGKGGINKHQVAAHLQEHYPQLSSACAGDQNHVDATCLALYGRTMAERRVPAHLHGG